VQHIADFPDVRPPPFRLAGQRCTALSQLSLAASQPHVGRRPAAAPPLQISSAEFVETEVEAGPGQLVLSVETFAISVSWRA
jgi:hypothetical protein